MFILQLIVLLWAIACGFWTFPASAQTGYPPHTTYSNAQIVGKDFSGQNLQRAEFATANLEITNFAQADLRGAVFSTARFVKANLHGANLSDALMDQVRFEGTDLSDAILDSTILLRSVFRDVNITGADFTNAILDGAQARELCQQADGVNSQTGVATRDSLGCR